MTDPQKKRLSSRLSYSISRLAEETDCGRSMIFAEIAAGRLVARKLGRRTIVRRSDAIRWLRSLPPVQRDETMSE